MTSDLDILRYDQGDDLPRRREPSMTGSRSMLGQVATIQSLIAVGKFLEVNPVTITGAEVEGGTVTVSADTSTQQAVYLLGPAVAHTGEILPCDFVEYRWVAERMTNSGGGGGVITLPGCPCPTTPRTINMVSHVPTCQGGMFQSCTLVYGPTDPMWAPLLLPANTWFSTTTFVDPISLDSFYWYFECDSGFYTIARIYPTSIFGNPFRDVVRFTWAFPDTGNTCSPWLFTHGHIFGGGDPTCNVSLSP